MNPQRLKILLTFIGVATLLVLIGNQPPQQTVPQDVQLIMSGSIEAEGTLSVLYGNDFAGTRTTLNVLTTAAGDILELVDRDTTYAQMVYHNLVGETVRITGNMVDADPLSSQDVPVLEVAQLSVLESAAVEPGFDSVTGNEKWANIACRFGDMTDVTPQPIEYFEGLMANDEPGMDHFWRVSSMNRVNIAGSGAFGWYDYPNDKTHYVRAATLNTGIALQMLMRDCVTLAQQNDGVDFTQFGGINVMLNDTFGCCAWGGRMAIPIDGKNITFRTTWMPPWAFNSLHVMAHEMGHGWGLPHSGGDQSHPRYPYDSGWDTMSGGSWIIGEDCRAVDDTFGCIQVGLNGFHLNMLGWLPQERIVDVAPGESVTLTLNSLAEVGSTDDTILVRVLIGGSVNRYYTVEARSLVAYDRNIPGEAVILHEVLNTRREPARVVDVDDNNNVNDAGAMWLPGETFNDARNNIMVEVLRRDGNDYTVRVTNK